VRPFGVSRDSHWSHRAWKEALGVDVPQRSAFLLDEDGTVRGSWRYDSSEVPDFDELLAAAQALRD
jgi:peroxiredoxin